MLPVFMKLPSDAVLLSTKRSEGSCREVPIGRSPPVERSSPVTRRAPVFLLQLVTTDAEGSEEGVAEDFALEALAFGGAHQEEGDFLAFGLGNDFFQFFTIGRHVTNDHDALDIGAGEGEFKGLHEEFGLGDDFLYGEGLEGEFSDVVFEGLTVEVVFEMGRGELFEGFFFLAVDEYGLHIVLAFTQPAVEGDAIQPVTEVGLGKVTTDDGFEMYDHVEDDFIQVVSIDQYEIGTPI